MKKILAFVVAVTIPVIATASSGGETKSYWNPMKVPDLKKHEALKLARMGCKIKSFREAGSPNRSKPGPDSKDGFMLTRSVFAAKRQKDLAVLCKSRGQKEEYIIVLWGGPKRCASKIRMSKGSRYYKKYSPSDGYYGDVLKPLWAAEVPRYITGMYDQYDMLERHPGHVIRRCGSQLRTCQHSIMMPCIILAITTLPFTVKMVNGSH